MILKIQNEILKYTAAFFPQVLLVLQTLSNVWFHWLDGSDRSVRPVRYRYECVLGGLKRRRPMWKSVFSTRLQRRARKETQRSKQNLSKPRVRAADPRKGSFKEIRDGKQWQQQGLWTSLSISTPPAPPPPARHTLKYSNRGVGRDTASWIQMADALNANAFSLSCCYQFIFSIWVLKRQIEVGRCPSATPRLPPGGRKAVRSQGNFRFPHTAHQGHLNTSQTAPIMPHCWQT